MPRTVAPQFDRKFSNYVVAVMPHAFQGMPHAHLSLDLFALNSTAQLSVRRVTQLVSYVRQASSSLTVLRFQLAGILSFDVCLQQFSVFKRVPTA